MRCLPTGGAYDLTSKGHEIAAAESLVSQADKLYDKKLVKIVDLLDARAQLALLRAEKVEAERQLMVARERLAELIGNNPGRLDALKTEVAFNKLVATFEEWLQTAQSRSTVLEGMRYAISAQEQMLKEEKSARLPILELQLIHQKSDLGFENSPRPLTTTDIAALEMNMPIYSGGMTSAAINQATSQLHKARAEYEAERRKLSKQVRDAYLGISTSLKKIAALESAQHSALTAAQASRKGMDLGLVTVPDVLEAESKNHAAARDANHARYEYITNWTRLLKASGVAELPALERINGWLMQGEAEIK